MEEELQNSIVGHLKVKNSDEDHQMTSKMEVDGNRAENLKFDEEVNIVFAREESFEMEERGVSRTGCHGAKRHKSMQIEKKDVEANETKLTRRDSTEVNRLFREAIISCDWKLAESMILDADSPTLDDFLCYLLNYVWFLWTKPALDETEMLIEMIISIGACDIRRAALSTSRLASFFLGCQCLSLDHTVTDMDESVQMLSELALDFIDFQSRLRGNTDGDCHNATLDIKLRLGVFETFLELVGNNLTKEDFTEAFDAAGVLLIHFSSLFYLGWSYGKEGTLILEFLGILVAYGANTLGQCFSLASRFGSTELLQVLLEIAEGNDVNVDFDGALEVATYYGNLSTMEYLIEECNANPMGPFVRSAERGCLPVVSWFVQRGCKDSEICVALIAATSSSEVQVAAYLLPLVPQYILSILGGPILTEAGKRQGSLKGIAFLLRSNFVGDPSSTYNVADSVARSEDENMDPRLKSFLREHWSKEAYLEGLKEGREHFLNVLRILQRGESPLQLRNLPQAVTVAIAYLPVYKESVVGPGGSLLSQRLRGQLVDAVRRLGNVLLVEENQSSELVAVMEHHLRPFL